MGDANRQDEDMYAFLAVYNEATLRFDVPVQVAEERVEALNKVAASRSDPGEARAALRNIVRTGFLDGHQLDPVRSQPMADAIIWLCLTNPALSVNPSARGLIMVISELGGLDYNFRFMAAEGREAVDEYTAELRKGRKYVVTHTPEEVAKAMARKRTPPPRDPNLEPPPRPRPERWLPALDEQERRFGRQEFAECRRCLEEGAMFVWRSRQLADAAQEEIDASLAAMAEYGRLRLPHGRIWAETRDWLDVPVHDAPPKRLPARFGIAASQEGDRISFWSFVDCQDEITMAILRADVDLNGLVGQRRSFLMQPPPIPDGARWNEAEQRRIANACGDHLLELLFLLSAKGVAKDNVRAGGGKPGKQGPKQRRMTARDYTVIRVPLTYVPDPGGAGGEGSGTGRWVRPHVRRAHTWGIRTRPSEKQHWREATLVGASKLEDGEEVRRPEYRVG